MKPAYRDILRHSAVYGLGQVLSRLASFLLLPLYTSYLAPADYGCIAILDLTAGVLGILIGSGMASAASRYHFETDSEQQRDAVWWTGLTFVALTATAICAPAFFLRDHLARLTLGPNEPQGAYFFALVLVTLWVGSFMGLPDVYLRVRKWSTLSVVLSIARLLLNIALNVFFLVYWRLGVAGILWGNLLTNVVMTAVLLAILARSRGPYALHWPLVRRLWAFGGPLILTALLQTVMHQADRYFLRLYLDLDEVGVYSLGYTIAQAVYTMCVIPFASIWNVAVYEIAKLPGANRVYARVFEYFTFGLMLILLGVSLLARPVITLMAAPGYGMAYEVIPIVCLGYLLFSLMSFFTIPAYLTKRTTHLVPGSIVGAAVNVAANFVLIPVLGTTGAAWATVLTFGSLSATVLVICRRIERIDLPIARVTLVGASFAGVYVSFEVLHSQGLSGWVLYPLGIGVCAAAGALLFGPLLWRMRLLLPRRVGATQSGVSES